jgi:acyl-homoserine-lactone acylase
VATWALLLASCAGPASQFDTEIRWTSYGIPHVKANDWGSLGYGFAYATAEDAVCVIARDIVMVNGELSKYLGPENGNLESDVFHRSILTPEKLDSYSGAQSEKSDAFLAGYVAGYNRYLRDNSTRLPASCKGEPWVREITEEDIVRLTVGVGIRYGLGSFQESMVNAAPPGERVASLGPGFHLPIAIGSNAVALGSAATDSGRGILFGNPHYPWRGSSRFHLIHTTIPNEVDVMGVSLATTARVAIGFNRDVAWSHTVSTALRFTLYRLELDPADPMQYRYGDELRAIEPVSVQVDVLGDDGELSQQERTIYNTHYGPILVSDSLPWTEEVAYALRDANLDNDRSAATYDALNRATSIDEVEAAISQQGVAWTNTIAADRHGTAFYADISVTPNVDKELLERCRVEVSELPPFVVVLDGADPSCEWKIDSRSAIPGALPAEEMPRLRRSDYVTNSNDSYWLSNPHEPLEGYSPIIGPERTARSLRTRAGLVFVEEQLADGGKFTPDEVQAMLYSHRNFGAELLLDDVLSLCDRTREPLTLEGESVDIARACDVLAGWDRRQANGSRGAQVWTEFWRVAQSTEDLYAVPFDPDDPVATPRGIATDNPKVASAIRTALARAQKNLGDAGILLDAEWGEIQYAERNGDRIPIPGGQGWAGMFSMIVADLHKDKGYTPIVAGNSYIQVISWDAEGDLDPRGILTYSQSQEPESPHYADQTRLYSSGEWVRFPFTEEEISADPNLRTLHLTE